jgi:hypothetical protein
MFRQLTFKNIYEKERWKAVKNGLSQFAGKANENHSSNKDGGQQMALQQLLNICNFQIVRN